jgi:hypothetical protein
MKVLPNIAVATLITLTPQLSGAAQLGNCIGDGFLPPNSLRISAFENANGMTEASFNAIIDKVAAFYAPVVAQQGAQLVFERKWNDGTVNAFASRNGNQWIVSMYGGLARHQTVTSDGFLLVVCHEVGHHLGGAPKYRGEWASNEGQSDYFATLKCLRHVLEKDDNVEIVKSLNIPATVTRQCEQSFSDAGAIALCQRTSMAGRSTAELMRALGGSSPIDFSTPDPSKVTTTQDQHPEAQCRLDTYFNGSICQVDREEPLSTTDATVGTCSEEKNFKRGVRPQCWYKPQSISQPTPQPTPEPTDGIALQPLFNGVSDYSTSFPQQMITIDYDVSNIPKAAGIYFEVSRPNQTFRQPNSTQAERDVTTAFARAGSRGQLYLVPMRHLPGPGIYQMRLIALDSTGTRPVSRFSNASSLSVRLSFGGYQSKRPARW